MVERRISTMPIDGGDEALEGDDPAVALDEIVLLDFNRRPKEMFDALGEGLPLDNCRKALSDDGHSWRLITGTMAFVYPWQYRYVMEALNDRELKRSQVVVARSLEHLVEESIVGIGRGVWASQRQELAAISDTDEGCSSVAVVSSDDDVDHTGLNRAIFEKDAHWTTWPDLEVTRCFICPAPRLPSVTIVVQSTTGVDSRKGRNPRRVSALNDVQ